MRSDVEVVISGAAAFTPSGDELAQRRDHPRLSRLSRLALAAVEPALDDAGLGRALGAETGLVLGSAFGPHATNEAFYRGILDGNGGSARLFAATLPSAPLGDISIALRATGLAVALTPGRHAALVALDHALLQLRHRRVERVVLIVADLATPLLGQLLGEPVVDGAAALVIETAAACAARQGRVRGRIVDVACTFAATSAEALKRASDALPAPSPDAARFEAATGSAAALACGLARWLLTAAAGSQLLAAVSDPGGGAAAALFSHD